jgi:CheY-like chemotaxis protein
LVIRNLEDKKIIDKYNGGRMDINIHTYRIHHLLGIYTMAVKRNNVESENTNMSLNTFNNNQMLAEDGKKNQLKEQIISEAMAHFTMCVWGKRRKRLPETSWAPSLARMEEGKRMEPLSKILVVDDEPQIQFLLEEFLTSLGHTVRLAGDGEQALRILQTGAFDGVIADLKMAKMGGMELLRLIRLSYPALPVIMMTGYPSVEVAVEAMKEGAIDFSKRSPL